MDLEEELILADAEPEQLASIRRYYMEQWQMEQEENVKQVVKDAALNYLKEKGGVNFAWFRWAADYICKRFKYLTDMEWVRALATLDDEALLWQHPEGKAAFYLSYVQTSAKNTSFSEEDC